MYNKHKYINDIQRYIYEQNEDINKPIYFLF